MSKIFSAKNFIKINGFSFLSFRKITVNKVIKRIIRMVIIIEEISWQRFTHINSLYNVLMIIFCWNWAISLRLIWIIKGLNGVIFKFWLFDLIGSLFAEILIRAHERVLNFLLYDLLVGLRWNSTKFRINTLNGFKLHDIKIAFTSFIYLISNEMSFDLRRSQCWHFFVAKRRLQINRE